MRSGFVTLIGRPNVGKSTLMNRIIGQKIAITSNKPQTTRNRIETVFTDDRGQIVFLDTPGIHKAKNKLGEYMQKVTAAAMKGVDLILWLIEPDEFVGGGDEYIAERLKGNKTPVILVINKIDTIPHENILMTIDAYKDLLDFREIIPVSALRKKGIDDLVQTIFNYLPEGPYFFDPDTITDQPEKAIVAEMVREKALQALSDEVPHGIAVMVESMKDRPDRHICDIDATIICEKDSHKGIIIGKHGSMLKKIGTNARYEIERLLGCKVNLKLFVKVKENWRDSEVLLANYGFKKEDEE